MFDLSATISTLNLGLGSTLSIQNARALTAADDFTNDGLIQLAGISGSTTFRIADPVDGAVTLDGSGSFQVADGSRFDFQGTTLDGVSLSADDQNADLSDNLYSLSSSGTVFKDVTLTATLSNNGNALTQRPSHTIENTGQIGKIYVNVVNQGLILANAATPLTFNPYSTFINSGQVRVENGSTISVTRQGLTN